MNFDARIRRVDEQRAQVVNVRLETAHLSSIRPAPAATEPVLVTKYVELKIIERF
jgi:hypothetical protein